MASTTNPEDEALLKESASWPLDRRISHSNWRVRSAAFDFVVDQTGAHAATRDVLEHNVGLDASTCLELLASSVGDQNANVMDRALDAFFAYLDALGTILVFVEGRETFDESLTRTAQVTMKHLSTKCLKASKRTTLVKSMGVCGALVEVDQGMAVVQGLVEGGFSHKVPKAVAAALEAALEIIRGFYGTGEYDQRRMENEAKELLGGIAAAKLYAHRDAAVRSRVKDVVVALMRTSKRVECMVRTKLLDKLPDAMQKEVLSDADHGDASPGESNEKMYTKSVQKRLRELAAAHVAGGADAPGHGEGPGAGGYADGDVEMMDVDVDVDDGREADQDPYEFAEPANIMPSLQKAKIKVDPDADAVPFWDCFGSKKWNVRKSALEMVRDAASKAVRLDPAERDSYASLVREFKVILAKDANIHCAATAAMASEAMAKALRSDFAGNAKLICPDLLGRFKEKNPVMSKAAESCLQSFATYCYSLKDVSDDIAAALSVKNPKVLGETLRYLTSLVELESGRAVALCKDSLAAAVKLLSDADSNVRQEAQAAVVAFAVAMGGFAAVKTHLNGVDDKKRGAIEKACETASATGGAAGQMKCAMKTPAAKSRPGSSRDPGSSRPAPGRKAGARPAAAPARATSTAVTKTAVTKTGPAAAFVENPVSKEEAEEILARTFGPGMVENLKSSLWQERVEAMSQIAERAGELFHGSHEREDVKRLLLALAHLPGWTDRNFQVVNKLFEMGTKAAELSPGGDFGPPHASCIVQGAVEKIHELKHREQASTALTAACQRVGPKYVVSLVHQRAAWHKNPKVLAESLAWMRNTIDQFGYNNIDSKGSVVAWMTDDLGSTDPNVKSKALALLGECHSQVGPGPFQSLMDSLQSKKPALATSMQEAFAKKPMDASYEPTLAVKSGEVHRGQGPRGDDAFPDSDTKGEFKEDADPSDEPDASAPIQQELVERVDVSRSLGEPLVAQLMSTNWKERNAAVESVEELIASAKHITADVPVEFLGALRKRFGDSNRNLAARSLSLVGMLATAVGPDFDLIAHSILLGPAVENLADMKRQVRDAVVGMLDAWGHSCGCDRLFPAIIDAVSNPKGASEGKVMALKWMVDHYEPNPRCRDSALKAAAAGAKDKAAPVRSMASQLEKLVEVQGVGRVAVGKPSKTATGATPAQMKRLEQSRGPTRTPAAKVAPKSAANSTVKSASRSTGKNLGSFRPEARAGARHMRADDMVLSMGQGKGTRSRQFRPRPGCFEAPTPGDRERLRELLAPVASTMLATKMFSGDFQDHIDALNALEEGVPDRMNELLTSLDLILQWIVLVLCEQNTQSSLRALDLLRVVLEHLADDGYRLSDMEASILLPAIIEKIGQNQDHMRSAYRTILVASASVYNPAKVVDLIILGLATRNSRSKVECCAAMSDIVQQTGGRCMTSAKNKPVVALSQLVTERDPALRSAAMGALESIRESVDEAMFTDMLMKAKDGDRQAVEGKLKPSKAKGAAVGAIPIDATTETGVLREDPYRSRQSYLESHQKSYPEPMHVDPVHVEPMPVQAAGAHADGVQRTLDLSSGLPGPREPPYSSSGLATPVSHSVGASNQAAATSTAGVHTPVPVQLKSTPSKSIDVEGSTIPIPQLKYDERELEQRWERNIELMYSANLTQAVDATKHVCSDIMMVTAKDGPPPSNRVKAVLSNTADKFVLAVCAQLEVIFADAVRQVAEGGENFVPPSSRGCKFALNALLQGLGVEDLAMGIPQGTLRTAISLLLCSLVDEHGLLCFEQGPTLVRAVNVLIAKMLDAANKNYAFAALLHLLRSPPSKSLGQDAVPKFNDLVVKCLIKLTKGLDSTDVNIDISFILLCLHDYFMFLGVEEIRRRSAAEDKPLRMVKTILHQICKLVGYNVYQYTSSIPGRHAQPQPIIFRYIDINLKMLKEMNQLPTDDGAGGVGGVGGAGPVFGAVAATGTAHHAGSYHNDDEEVRVKLKDVLSRVTSKDPSVKDVSMRELLDLKRKHPQMVERYLNATQDRFRKYIEDGLLEMAGGGHEAPSGGSVAASDVRLGGGGAPSSSSSSIPSFDNLAERLDRLRQRM